MNSSSDGPFSFDSKGERIDIATGVVFSVFSVFPVFAFEASVGDVWGVSVGSEVRIDFLEQQAPIGSILGYYLPSEKIEAETSLQSWCPILSFLSFLFK